MKSERGFTLAGFIFFATAMSILLATAVPVLVQQAKREQEEELIFRGEDVVRAIQKYQRKFGSYPPTWDALLETNGLRFLRKDYKDPITGKAFRLITVNPDGSLNGSTLMNQRIGNAPLFPGGNPATFGSTGGPTPSGSGLGAQPGGAQGPQGPGNTNTGGANSRGGPGSAGAGGVNRPGAGGPTAQGGGSRAGFSAGPQPTQPGSAGPSGGQGPGGGTFGSAGLVGVASDSSESTLKTYNTRQQYNEWEFLALAGPGGGAGGGGPQVNPGGVPTFPGPGQPGQINSGSRQGQGNTTGFPNQPGGGLGSPGGFGPGGITPGGATFPGGAGPGSPQAPGKRP